MTPGATGVFASARSENALMFTAGLVPKEPSAFAVAASWAMRFVRGEMRAGSIPAAWAKRIVFEYPPAAPLELVGELGSL